MKIKMIFICTFFVFLNSFNAFALPSCSTTIKKKYQLFPECNPICVTLTNNIDLSNLLEKDNIRNSGGVQIIVSRWDIYKRSLRQNDVFILPDNQQADNQQASFWVCPSDKITTAFHIYERSPTGIYYTRETHCAIFNATSSNRPSSIEINGTVKSSQIFLDYYNHTIKNVNYSIVGVNKIGSFKGDEDPYLCTPDSHPDKKE